MRILDTHCLNAHCFESNVLMLSKRLLSDTENLVQESLEGLCIAAPHLRLLDGFPHFKVALDAEHNRHRHVALISGGGSGHEPAFAGYVGTGMLTAAVCGDIYAAPSAEAILSAIRSVTGDAGCLLLPINYTGDRLNFEKAQERARALGYCVETVLIDDDCAVVDTGSVGRRGLAGSVLLIKLVGALAQRGASLNALTAFAQKAVRNLGTMGIGLDTCALPGEPRSASRLQPDEIELGLGIHGEPGVQKMQDVSLDSAVEKMVRSVTSYLPSPFVKDSKVGVLVNNLGGMAVIDLNVIGKRTVQTLREKCDLDVDFMLAGTFMTSVSVAGFSITLLKMEEEEENEKYIDLLNASTAAVAWTPKHISPFRPQPKIPLPFAAEEEYVAEALTPLGSIHRRCVEAVVDCMIAKEEILNDWDRQVGDGDCGSTLANACKAIRTDMDSAYPFNRAVSLLRAIGRSIGRASGGTSGSLYQTLLYSAADSMESTPEDMTGLARWVRAFESGVEAVQKQGGAQTGDRTMIDALEPASRALSSSLDAGDTIAAALQKTRRAAEQGAESTLGMFARRGRSTYVSAELYASTPDPGAKAVEFWISALVDCLLTETVGNN